MLPQVVSRAVGDLVVPGPGGVQHPEVVGLAQETGDRHPAPRGDVYRAGDALRTAGKKDAGVAGRRILLAKCDRHRPKAVAKRRGRLHREHVPAFEHVAEMQDVRDRGEPLDEISELFGEQECLVVLLLQAIAIAIPDQSAGRAEPGRQRQVLGIGEVGRVHAQPARGGVRRGGDISHPANFTPGPALQPERSPTPARHRAGKAARMRLSC